MRSRTLLMEILIIHDCEVIHMSLREVLTIENFWDFPDDGQIHEIINGLHVVSKAPKIIHQKVSGNIGFIIRSHIEDDLMLYSPIGLFLGNENGVMPDIVVMNKDNLDIVKEKGVYGAPDWIIEIMSPGNRRNDLVTKKSLYKKYGIKEYWCVDTEIDQIHIFTYKTKFSEEIVKLSEQTEFISDVFKIKFDLSEIFEV